MKIKNKVTIISIVLLAVLVTFTFVSRTIYHKSLPLVTAVTVNGGSITLSADSIGTIEYPEAKKLGSAGTWTVNSVKVKDGEKVSKGDVLCTFDTKASNINIQTLQLNVLIQKVALEKQKQNTGKSKLTSLQEALNKKQKDVIYQQVITKTQLNIAQEQLDLAISQAPPADGLVAPIDGLVYGLTVKSGTTVQPGEIIVWIVPNDSKAMLTFKLPSDKGGSYGPDAVIEAKLETLVTEEDKKIKYQQETVYGVVKNCVLRGESWEYKVELDKLKGQPVAGQDVPLQVSNDIVGAGQFVIPIGCLFNDGNGGKCVYVIEERKGLFGLENYVTGQTVSVISDNGKSALVSGKIDVKQVLANNPSRPIFADSVVSRRNY